MKKVLLATTLAVTLAGCVSNADYSTSNGGGGGIKPAYQDQWKDSNLVDDLGNVTMNPGEVKTDHPSTAPTDSGFQGDGPPSIDF